MERIKYLTNTKEQYLEILRYADFAVIVSLWISLAIYLLLPILNLVSINESYEFYFDGATSFQSIISTVVYFIIIKKYGWNRK